MNRRSLSLYLNLFAGRRLVLLGLSLLLVLQPAALAGSLVAIRNYFNVAISEQSAAPLAALCLALGALYLFSGGIALLLRYQMMRQTDGAIGNLRRELLMRLYAYPRQEYLHFDRRRLQTVLVQDVIRVDVMSNAIAGQLIPSAVIVLAIGCVLAWLTAPLFLLLLVILPFLVGLEVLLRPRMRRYLKGHHAALASLHDRMLFALEALDLTHSRGAVDAEIERQEGAGDWFRRQSTRLAMMRELRSYVYDLLFLAVTVACLLLGASLVMDASLGAGDLLAFYMGLIVARPHAQTCWNVLPQISEGFVSLETLVDWLDRPHRAAEFGTQRIEFDGSVAFRDVAFAFADAPVLTGVSFALAPGQSLAVVGDNGAGKSTIVHLLLGLYGPDSGEVSAGGIPLGELDIVDLRRQIGVVPQTPQLFTGTIADNIAYGTSEQGLDALADACRLAGADLFIDQLAEGYGTRIGDDGATLSGGQRQKLALARAVLGRPPLLILDEPANHLDADATAALLQRFADADYHPAVLLISHEQSLISACNRTLRLQHGRLHPMLATSPAPSAG